MTAIPVAKFVVPGAGAATTASEQAFLGASVPVSVRFTNDATAGETGYVPYIDVVVPAGLSYQSGSASFLGAPVAATLLTFPASGAIDHPFARNADGTPLRVLGAPGAQLLVLQLPFGSFAAGQTPADITFNVAVAGSNDLGVALPPITATAGFAWGENPLGAPQADWPVIQAPAAPVAPASSATLAITPALITLTDTYNGPQQEAASGPALAGVYHSESWTVQSRIALSQTIADFTLTNPVPKGATVGRVVLAEAGRSWTYLIDPATGAMALDKANSADGAPPVVDGPQPAGKGPWVWWDAASNTVQADFGSVTGVASGADPSITTYFEVAKYQPLGWAREAAAFATDDLTVTDMLPYGAVAQVFTLVGPDGSTWRYSVEKGVATLVSGNADTAPKLVDQDAGAGGSAWVWYDVEGGRIVADFGPAKSGQWASIDAAWQGGQAQPQPGVIQQVASQDGLMQVVDQLAGNATAQRVTLNEDGQTYTYDLDEKGNLVFVSGDEATAPGVGQGEAEGRWIVWDAAHHRIVANLGKVAAGHAAAIASTFSGGLLLDASNPVPVALSNAPSAGGSWSHAGAEAVAVSATLPGGQDGAGGSNTVFGAVLTLQKSVAAADRLAPLGHLTWSVQGQVSNYFDLGRLTLTDTMSDGQHWDATVTPVLVVNEGGQTYKLGLGKADYTVSDRAADGTTTTVFDLSHALAEIPELGGGGNLNGGAAPDSEKPSTQFATTFKLTFGSQIDQSWAQPPAGAKERNWVGQGDSIGNNVRIDGNVLGADGKSLEGAVSDTSSAGVTLARGGVGKSVYEIVRDGKVIWLNSGSGNATPDAQVQSGDIVVYRLHYSLPLTRTHGLAMTDYLPQPLFSVGSLKFADGIAKLDGTAAAAPALGTIEFSNSDQFHTSVDLTVANNLPIVTLDKASNAFTVNFGDIEAKASDTYPSTGVDLVYSAQVQDAAFGQGLLFTNEVTAREVNSAGAVATSSAIVQVVTGAPYLKIEKGVVATTDAHATFSAPPGGGVAWGKAGGDAAFAGTMTSAGLLAAPVGDNLANVGGGETVRYALVVQNTGGDSHGAWDVTLRDSAIPAGMALVEGSVRVVNGAGAPLAFTAVGGGLFDPKGGIVLTDPLAAYDAASGKNIAVVTYDLRTTSAIATPGAIVPNVASIVGFSDRHDGVNRIATLSAVDSSATAEIATASPTLAKAFASAQDGDAATALKIGEAATFDILVTLPGGTASNVVLADILPSGGAGTLSLVSATIKSVGADIAIGSGVKAGTTSATGSFDLGTVTVASDARGAADQIALQVVAVAKGNVAANKAGVTLVNTARLTEADPSGVGTVTQTATASVTLAEPKLSIAKQVQDLTTKTGYKTSIAGNAGDTLQYDITLKNAAGSATAYQIDLKDLLTEFGKDALGASNFTMTPGTLKVTAPDGQVATIVPGSGVEVTLPALAAGQTLDVTFQGKLSADAYFKTAVVNSATYTANTLPATDPNIALPGYNRVETGKASATVTISQPSIAKAFTGGSDSSLALPKLAVGETGTFTLTVTLPQGDSQDLRVLDILPSSGGVASLAYVPGSAKITGVTGVASTAGVTLTSIGAGGVSLTTNAANNSVLLDFGAVRAAAGATITLTLAAQLADVAAVQNNVTLTNTAEVLNGASLYGTLVTVPVVVAQPSLSVIKTEAPLAPGARVDAGSVQTYSVTINPLATMTSAAYNVAMKDVLPADMVVFGTPTVSNDAAAVSVLNGGHEIDVTLGRLAVGAAPVVLTYQAKMLDSVTPGETLTDVASLTYTTQSTTLTTSTSNGRTLTPLSASASQPVSLTPALVKSVLSVSDSHLVTPSGAAPSVAVGDVVTYKLFVTPGHGTQHLVLKDVLGAGLTYQGVTFASAGGTTAAAPVVSNSGGTVTMDFGTIVNPGGNDGGIEVDLAALVGPSAIGATLINNASVTTASPGGAGLQTATVTQVPVSVVAPKLAIAKTSDISGGQGGSLVTYTVVVQQAADNGNPAYNLLVADQLAAGLVLVPGSEKVTEGGRPVAGAVVTETAGGLSVALPSLFAQDGALTITYAARLANDVVDTAKFVNTATLGYSGAPTGGATFSASAQALVTADIQDSFVKTLFATSAGGVPPGDVPAVTQGETLTYHFTATLGAGAQHLVIADKLPAGLTYVSSSVVSLGATTGSALSPGAAGIYSSAAGTVTFDFGAAGVVNAASNIGANAQVVVAVVAKVDGAVPIGTTLTDTGSLTASVPQNGYGVAAGSDVQVQTSKLSVEVVPANTIDSRVFLDSQCNGVYHMGDAGVQGVTVKLFDSHGVFTGRSTATDSNGRYLFTNVPDGQYKVQFLPPAGMDLTDPRVGSDDTLNSQPDPSTGFTPVFTLQNQETDMSVNAGIALNGNFAGQTPVHVDPGVAYSANQQTPVIIGSSDNNIHTNAGNNTVVFGTGFNIFEGNNGTAMVFSCGRLEAQGLGTDGWIFGGAGGNVLTGGSGNVYLMGGRDDDQITGGTGLTTLVGGGSNGSVTVSNGVVTAYKGGDLLTPGAGASTTVFQKGDHVDVMGVFVPGHDTIQVYGYAGVKSVSQVDGHTVLYFGDSDAIVFNDTYVPPAAVNGGFDGVSFPGIQFIPSVPLLPTLALRYGADGLPYLAPPTPLPKAGAALPTLATANDLGSLKSLAATPERLIAGDGATFTLEGNNAGGNVLIGGKGNDTLTAHGSGNTIQAGDGDNTISGGNGGANIVAGNGNNRIRLAGSGNVLVAGDGDNTVQSLGDDADITLGAGANSVTLQGAGNKLSVGGGGNVIHLDGDNSVVTIGAPPAGQGASAFASADLGLSGWTMLTAHDGVADTYVIAPAPAQPYAIQGFAFGSDRIDLSRVLADTAWDRQTADLGSFIRVSDTAMGTQIDLLVGGDAPLAALVGAHGMGLADLLSHNALRLG